MAGPKKGENTKKAAGNAKKAEVAAQKRAEEEAKAEKAESKQWQKGAKDNSKQEAAEAKAAEAARKKAEKDALREAEEASLPSKPAKPAGAKSAQKKSGVPTAPSRGLDFSQLEASDPSSNPKGLNARGIDDSIAALSIANNSGAADKVDRHPERRFKAAYTAYEARRLDEMKDDASLRRGQKIEAIRKEFEKSPENPFNQALVGTFDMSKEEVRELKQQQRDQTERRLEG